MAERRAKGLCMFCDELFTPGHYPKHCRAQVMIELEGDEPTELEPILQEIPNLSLTYHKCPYKH